MTGHPLATILILWTLIPSAYFAALYIRRSTHTHPADPPAN